MPTAFILRTLRKLLELAQDQLCACISLTATGDTRNKLCDANIFLGSAIKTIKELES
jgi:hypothetical protein